MTRTADSETLYDTIMVVDDEESLREIAIVVLEGMGYRTVEASDGLEAVEKYQEMLGSIALVFMDVNMPRMGGIEATQRIRELDPGAKVIICSGSVEYMAEGFRPDAALPKPYRVAELRELVGQLLGPPWRSPSRAHLAKGRSPPTGRSRLLIEKPILHPHQRIEPLWNRAHRPR